MTKSEITVDVTYECKLNCSFCSTNANPIMAQMPFDIANACLDFMQFAKQSYRQMMTVVVSGGEPLLRTDLAQIIEIWNSKADEMILCTSGSVETGQEYWNNLSSCGLRSVRLSLHGVSPDMCRDLFGPEYSFATIQRTITAINEAGLVLDLNYVLNKQSAAHLGDVFSFAADHRVRKVRVLGLARQGRAALNWDSLEVSRECEEAIIAKAKKLSSEHRIAVELAGLSGANWCSHSDAEGNCLGGKTFFHITTSGDIYPCPGVKALAWHKMGSVLQPAQVKSIFDHHDREAKCLVLSEAKQLCPT
ncbi:MAG: radical SAM protein [Phycisphaerae bacterium]|nr:radical SAM protein [Phycisphaerae bacterium]